MGQLTSRRAIITGGNSGIGAAIALAFAREGAVVAILHRNDTESARTILSTLPNWGGRHLELSCDVTSENEVRAAVARVESEIGACEILVNNAGIGLGKDFENMTLDIWRQVMEVNLTGVFLMAHACYPAMKLQRWGRIINISSQMALKGCPAGSAYCASKAGLIGLTRALAWEGAHYNVLVNCIAPGAIDVGMTTKLSDEERARVLADIPLGRFGQGASVAATAVLLASDDGDFYVGQTLSPNGGDVFF